MNAVIYARYSSDSQREESIEGQLRECREYAERNNMTIVGTYIDRALSAKTADRPEFQHMIKDSAKELFEIVLVWKLDRFSRDRYDSAHYKHILKKNLQLSLPSVFLCIGIAFPALLNCTPFVRQVWYNTCTKEWGVFSMPKYSLQGTTQGRYLTGGVPPVRFSM